MLRVDQETVKSVEKIGTCWVLVTHPPPAFSPSLSLSLFSPPFLPSFPSLPPSPFSPSLASNLPSSNIWIYRGFGVTEPESGE